MPFDSIPLWSEASAEDGPTLTFYPSEASDGATVLVCPGGGYSHLAEHEGPTIAQWLSDRGFHAAVLRYRVAPHKHPAMIHDVQRGLRMLRARAAEWGVRPDAVGVLGFSAGGHLAGSAAVHHTRFTNPDDDLAAEHSARPDAAVLCYPVIDLIGANAHMGSRANLLGDPAHPLMVDVLSHDKHVDATTPATFLWHTADDPAVPMENSLAFAAACRRNQVPVELHVYESGRHGLGLAHEIPTVATWGDLCLAFLHRHLDKAADEAIS